MKNQIAMFGPPLPALAVANELVKLSYESGEFMDIHRLQYLIYLASGWHQALFKKPLVSEQIMAAHAGPCVDVINEAFSRYGENLILGMVKPITQSSEPTDYKIFDTIQNKKVLSFLRMFSGDFRRLSIQKVEKMVKEAGGAWFICRIGMEMEKNIIIHDSVLHDHFFDMGKRLCEKRSSQ